MQRSIFRIFVVLLVSTFAPLAASAQEAGGEAAWNPKAGLAVIDWLIIVAYGLGTISLGWFYSRRQKSTQEYLSVRET